MLVGICWYGERPIPPPYLLQYTMHTLTDMFDVINLKKFQAAELV